MSRMILICMFLEPAQYLLMVEEDINDAEDAELDKADNPAAKENSPDTPVLKINPSEFEYDQNSDTVKPKNKKAFEKLIDQHPTVHTLKRGENRDRKVAGLKAKVLDTLKVAERKKRDLSCDS